MDIDLFEKIAIGVTGALTGGILMGLLKNYQIKKLCKEINYNTIDRLKTMSGLFGKVNEIMQDPMTSGDEKEALVAEQLAFVEMIVQQPII